MNAAFPVPQIPAFRQMAAIREVAGRNFLQEKGGSGFAFQAFIRKIPGRAQSLGGFKREALSSV